MKRQAILVALLAFAFQTQAVPVSVDQARRAARAWAYRGGTLGARLGTTVERASTQTLPNGAKIHTIQMRGGGTVFLSADTEIEPIIAFTPETADCSTLDPNGPLWALLCRDAEVRGSGAPSVPTASAGSQAAVKTSAAQDLWAKLLSEGAALDDSTVRQPSRAHATSVGDLRAGPLVQSKWDQSEEGGKSCYNRFTPLLSDGTRAVCGCVATAMAQVMRYHNYPTAARVPVTRTCYVQPSTRGKTSATNLTTQAGVYDWANMPLVPKSGVTDAQCDAIGKLTSDAGISVFMAYDTLAEGGSGSFVFNVGKALTEVFGYASAAYYRADEISANAGVMQRAMFSNFDAGYPVLMGISGGSGQAIVGDGYGYNSGTVYIHLNMGWSGSNDFWYNLPDIDVGHSNFTVFGDLVFNIFPTTANSATLAGRVTDEDGGALAGVAVRVCAAGSETCVTNGMTTASGVYGFQLPTGSYDVEIEKTGCPVERQEGVRVPETRLRKEDLSGWIVVGEWHETYPNIPVVTSVGNAWGMNAQITEPRARIVVGGVTNVYATLDKAVAAAKTLASSEPVRIEILERIPLNEAVTIDFPCVLTATEGADAMATPVVRNGNAALTVAAGGVLTLSNVTFAAASTTVVSVANEGLLNVASKVDFGVPVTIPAVRTAVSGGFVLTEGLTNGFAIDCAAACDAGEVFGKATCDYLTASNCAARISNVNDSFGETRGVAVEEGGAILLKWGEISVPVNESAGYFVDASGGTNTAARLDRLLEKFENMQLAGAVGLTAEVIVRDFSGLSFGRRVTVNGDMTVRGESAGVAIAAFGAAAGFDIGTNATLTVHDLTFDGYKGDSLFRVTGGELNLGGGTRLIDLEGTNDYSGALTILSGKATVGSPSGSVVFDGCRNNAAKSCGGAVYLKDDTCELVLQNHVVVTNCRARHEGGGIYMGKKSVVRLSGYLTIQDNVVQADVNTRRPSNLCYSRVSAADPHTLFLSGPFATGSAIGIRGGASGANTVTKEGGTFLAVESTVARADVLRACNALFCDTDAELTAAPSDDYATVQWEKDDGGIHEVDPSVAVARLVGEDGSARWYGVVEDAFDVLSGAATIEILADATLMRDIAVSNVVTLTSGAGGPFVLSRTGSEQVGVVKGGALTVSSVTVAGGQGPVFNVQEGALALDDGATVRDVVSGANRAGGAIKVYKGSLTMRAGSAILNCANSVADNSRGGAVTADTLSHVRLLGGTVADCVSDRGGGIYIGNETTVEIGGAFTAIANTSTDGRANNLYVSERSLLTLVSPLTGRVGYVPGVTVSSNVFGRVSSDFSGTSAQIVSSAHNFTHDLTGDIGIAVKGGDLTRLVWSNALDVDGKVTVDGTDFEMISGGEVLCAEITHMVTNFVYDATEKTCVLEGYGYVVSGAMHSCAGSYTATATLKRGFVWADGTTAPRTFSWTIAKAVYDMSGVSFSSRTFDYDGTVKSLAISGELPIGVTVAYVGNGKSEIGVYTVTARFTGDADNYEPILDLTATLTIVERPPEPPEPESPVVTNYPTPIAFRTIARVSDTEWTLEVTNRVPWCLYRLLSTDDLTKGFVTTGAWEQASAATSPLWTTNVITTGGARFWKAEAKEGVVEE